MDKLPGTFVTIFDLHMSQKGDSLFATHQNQSHVNEIQIFLPYVFLLPFALIVKTTRVFMDCSSLLSSFT
uniref:Uncharacterized protein n=1 Tax=Rhizophora mucronata TaxID=61149 RepID=A0A2P2NKY3_RHIMU